MINNLKKISLIVLIVGLLVPSLTFAGWFSKNKKITLTGSTTVLPIAQKCAESYMAKIKNAELTVSGGGSGVGITALIDGRTDIADSSRKIKDSEIKDAAAKNVKPYEYEIAKDGIVIILNKSITGIKNLSLDQLKSIYTGKIKNWKELGGNDAAIVVASRDTSSGTYETFETMVIKGEKVTADALMLASNNAVVSTVSSTPNSIGYIGIGYKDAANDIKIISVENIMPDKETILNGKYKIARSLYMYTNGKAKGEVENFINFVLSSEGQKIVEAEGFVTLK